LGGGRGKSLKCLTPYIRIGRYEIRTHGIQRLEASLRERKMSRSHTAKFKGQLGEKLNTCKRNEDSPRVRKSWGQEVRESR